MDHHASLNSKVHHSLPFFLYYLLFIIYYLLFIIYYLLFFIYCILFIIYYLLFIIYYLLFIIIIIPLCSDLIIGLLLRDIIPLFSFFCGCKYTTCGRWIITFRLIRRYTILSPFFFII